MSWGTPNVSEQRARFMARPATGSPPAPPRRHFLIANLELEIPITTVFSDDYIFLIANILRFFILSHKGLAVREQGLTLKHERLISRHRFLVTPSLITGHCLPNRDTAIKKSRNLKKTKSIPISNRDKSGTFCSRFVSSRSARRARVAASHASRRDHLPAFSASMLESKTR